MPLKGPKSVSPFLKISPNIFESKFYFIKRKVNNRGKCSRNVGWGSDCFERHRWRLPPLRISISKIEYSNIWTKSGSKDEADTPRFSILIFSKTTFDSFSKCIEKKEDVWKREITMQWLLHLNQDVYGVLKGGNYWQCALTSGEQ